MARAWFCRGSEDFSVAGPIAPGDPYRPAADTWTFWDAETGGTQWDDLLLAGTTPVTSIDVPVSGQPPAFQGPDGVVAMWVQGARSSARRMIDAGADIAVQAAADREAVAADRAAVEAIGTTNDTVIAGRINDPASATAAALSTSYEQRGGIVVLASKYGAVGDDATDSLTALTNALTDIKAASAFAKAVTLKLGRGTFLVSSSVALDAANLCVIGDGKNATTVKLSAAVAGSHGVFDITGTGCRIESMTIDANAKVNWAVYGLAATRTALTDVTVTGTVDHGIYLNDCDYSRLSRVLASGCGNSNHAAGFFTSACDHLWLDACAAEGSFEHGFYLLGGADSTLVMTGCIATGNGGIGLSPRYSRMTVTGCVSWGNGQGAFSSSYPVEPSTKGSRAVVTGNVLGGSTGTVANEFVVTGIDNYTVTGCYIETSLATSAAVLFSTLNEVTFTGNQVVSTSAATPPTGGVRFTSVTGYLVTGNTIKGGGAAGGNGVYVASSSSGKVAENRIDGWNTGVTLSASASNDAHVINNQILNFTVRVSNSSTGTNCVISGNALPAYFDPGVPLRLPVYATASRPSASTAGNGGLVVDSDLNRIIWSNGSSWKVAPERLAATATLDFPSIAAGASAELAIGVSLSAVGDAVICGAPATIEAGLVWNAYVSAGGTVKVRLSNITAAAIDPASASWTVTIVR